jgi:hypothetical protein
MSFGYVSRDIQESKLLASILKSVSLESDNSLWSWSIELKFYIYIKDIYLMCFPESQGVWNSWKWIINHFVFRSKFEVISRK